MKISIYNFKSIKELKSFEIKPLTLIAGVNNSGKSSLFQFLLLIKQTLELASTTMPLASSGDFFSTSSLPDLVFRRDAENALGISFEIKMKDFPKPEIFVEFGILSSSAESMCVLDIRYTFENNKPVISEFKLLLDSGAKKNPFLRIYKNGAYRVSTNVSSFGDGLWAAAESGKTDVLRFEAFFPSQFQLAAEVAQNQESKSGLKSFNLPPIMEFLSTYFSNISYIGPVRISPQRSYPIDSPHRGVGIRGEFSAQILQSFADEPIEFFKVNYTSKGVNYVPSNGSLIEAVKYWMCDIFGIGRDIYAEERVNVYQIFLENQLNLKITINHVGFGISQLLPIVIEGLLMPQKGLLVLEEPESHLHPKLQQVLFDFLYSLVRQGKIVLMETHSDHFITRMRRRVAEDLGNKMVDDVSVYFSKLVDGETKFEHIDLDEFGVLEYFPEDFIELADTELSAIVKAQIDKRRLKTEK